MQKIKTTLLFNAANVALVVTALTFATRGGFISPWMEEFGLTATQVGWIVGTAFWGFTLAMVVLGPLVDVIGLGRVLTVAFTCHVLGLGMTIFASGFWSLFFSTLLIGLANGSVEAACNPLVTALYPNDKTTKLNLFHMWFPAGIVFGGLLVYFFQQAGWGWRWQTVAMLLPTVAYGIMFMGLRFPETERVTSGTTYKEMLKATVSPLFLFMAFFMMFTAATEQGTMQWITVLLKNSLGKILNEQASSILILVWISAVMALARLIAGPVVHRLSGIGVLLFSAVGSGIGLYLMSISSGIILFAAATVFAIGVAYFWPNMLGVVAENVPASGALGLALMGGFGFLGGSIAQPAVGYIYDRQLIKFGNQLEAGAMTLKYVTILTVILTIAFLYLFLKYRSKNKLKAQV